MERVLLPQSCWNPLPAPEPLLEPRTNPLLAPDPPPFSVETSFERSARRGSSGGSSTFEPILNQASRQWYTLFPSPTNTRNNILLN